MPAWEAITPRKNFFLDEILQRVSLLKSLQEKDAINWKHQDWVQSPLQAHGIDGIQLSFWTLETLTRDHLLKQEEKTRVKVKAH